MNTSALTQLPVYGLQRMVARFPFLIFFALAYLLSWWSVPFGGQLPHGPMLAALVVLAFTQGRSGIRVWWRQFTHWRVGRHWYLIAPGIVAGYHLVASVLNMMAGAAVTPPAQLDVWGVLMLLWPLLLMGGQWEEPGWCGYALPRLQHRFARHAYGPIIANLILGLLRGLWHLPLYMMGYVPWYDMLFLALAMQFIAAWLYNRTRGSLPVVMLFHLTSNIFGATMPLLFAGTDYETHTMLFIVLACLIALVIVGIEGPHLGLRPETVAAGDGLSQRRTVAKSRSWSGWIRQAGVWFVTVVAVLALAGASWQGIATTIDLRRYPAPGEMVDVGGFRMHIHCMGEGIPTVILGHVGATNSAQWALIQPEIAKSTRVCAYDRAGFGWSETGSGTRDAQSNAQELHTLLSNAGIDGPIIFAGHSYGANVARVYAAHYPEQTAGLLLIDPGTAFGRPGVAPELDTLWRTQDTGFMNVAPWLARLGVVRLAGALGVLPGHGDLPSPQADAFDALQRTTRLYDALKAEAKAMAVTSQQILAAEEHLSGIPLIVLSAALPEHDPSREAWIAVNAEIAARSTNGLHLIVPGSDHMSLALDRDDAAVTTNAILTMVEAIHTGQPLKKTTWE